MTSLGLQIEQHKDAYSLSVANDSSDSDGSQFSGQKAFGITNQVNKGKNGLAGRYFDDENKKGYAEGILCRNHFAFEVLTGNSPAARALNDILDNITNSVSWALNVNNAIQKTGIDGAQKDSVLSTLSDIKRDNNLDLSTLSMDDTPETAARKMALANPALFAISSETNLPLRANELAQSCSTPKDISALCGGQGLSQDHAILLFEAMQIEQMAQEMTYTPKAWELALNVPAPAGMH